jgi:hypothetical protein
LFFEFALGEQHSVFKHRGLDVRHTPQTPAGDGHALNQIEFDGIGGLITMDVGVEEMLEVVFRFELEEGEAGGESMTEGVLDERALPSAVTGPLDLAPLARADSAFDLLGILVSGWRVACWSAGSECLRAGSGWIGWGFLFGVGCDGC